MSYLNSISMMENCKSSLIDWNESVFSQLHLRLSAKLSDKSKLAKTFLSKLKTIFSGKSVSLNHPFTDITSK